MCASANNPYPPHGPDLPGPLPLPTSVLLGAGLTCSDRGPLCLYAWEGFSIPADRPRNCAVAMCTFVVTRGLPALLAYGMYTTVPFGIFLSLCCRPGQRWPTGSRRYRGTEKGKNQLHEGGPSKEQRYDSAWTQQARWLPQRDAVVT